MRQGAAGITRIQFRRRHLGTPDKFCQVAEALFFLPQRAVARRQSRGEPAQLYEQNETQRALVVFYKELARYLPNDRVILVDASGTADQVEEAVYGAYKDAFR